MTYIVNESCIRCKTMDCVEVCPVDCFYEGENMLVIHPDECMSTPEQKCIGWPEQKYISDAGKKAPELGAFCQASSVCGIIRRGIGAGRA